MYKNQISGLAMALFMTMLWSCSKEDSPQPAITLFSATINGSTLVDGMENVEPGAMLELVFSTSLKKSDFESALSIRSASDTPGLDLTYLSQASRVQITTTLQPNATYTLRINDSAIGQNGERLESPLERTFTTAGDDVITSLPPCTSGTNNCLQTVALTADGTANFQFYSSFPIYEPMAKWEDLRAAIIVVHGANRNANDYFNYLMNSLQAEGLETGAVLIAPFFKTAAEAGDEDLYWSGNGWREGQPSAGPAGISSFEVVDQLITQLANKERFPALEKAIVTGHSSGGLFTHLYAAANRSEAAFPDLTFEYIVANSQYFFYPDGRRIDESTNQLYTPTGCTGYDLWPIGYEVVPPYVSQTELAAFNGQFLARSITYLLGNGGGPDGALNDTDCFATLLGSTRYKRGENMFRYMELAYPGGHGHGRVVVEGVGHDGGGMYRSEEFRELLEDILNL